MDEKNFYRTLNEMFEAECSEVNRTDCVDEIIPEKLENRILRGVRKNRNRNRITRALKVCFYSLSVVLIAGIDILSAKNAKALGLAVRHLWIDGDVKVISNSDSSEYPVIHHNYKPEVFPEGFEAVESHKMITFEEAFYLYINKNMPQQNIFFEQYLKSKYKNIDYSGNAEYCYDAAGNEYIVVQDENNTEVIWEEGDYVFILGGNIGKDELVSMRGGVK